MQASARTKRIVILGGGFAGVATARHLEKQLRRRRDIEIVLVSRDNFVVMTPLLFEVFSGTLDLRDCTVPVRAFLRRTSFVEATVTGVDLNRRFVRLNVGTRSGEMDYDHLVLAMGSKTNRNMIPGAEHAFTFKSLADALILRNHVIERFERADVETNQQRKAQLLTFVVIGGGLVGVELLGELTAFVDGIAPMYENVNRDAVRFVLLQGGERLMPEIDPSLADYGTRVLASRHGVDLRTSTPVRAIEPGKVHLADETISADTIVLAAGNIPEPALTGRASGKGSTRAHRGCVDHAMPPLARGVVAGRLRVDSGSRRQTIPEPGSARLACGSGSGRKHRRGARGKRAAAVRVPHAGNDGIAGPLQGFWATAESAAAWVPGVVRSPHLLPLADARLEPAAANHDRLDVRSAVSAGHRQDRSG